VLLEELLLEEPVEERPVELISEERSKMENLLIQLDPDEISAFLSVELTERVRLRMSPLGSFKDPIALSARSHVKLTEAELSPPHPSPSTGDFRENISEDRSERVESPLKQQQSALGTQESSDLREKSPLVERSKAIAPEASKARRRQTETDMVGRLKQ